MLHLAALIGRSITGAPLSPAFVSAFLPLLLPLVSLAPYSPVSSGTILTEEPDTRSRAYVRSYIYTYIGEYISLREVFREYGVSVYKNRADQCISAVFQFFEFLSLK